MPEVVQDPRLHVADKVPMYPELHVGVHVVPVAEFATQVPAPEFAMSGSPEQDVLVHVPVELHTALEHVAERVPVYPLKQTGVQIVPEEAPETQFPAPELEIGGSPVQAVLVQDPVVDQVPELHVAERVPVYPVAHAGEHVVPLLMGRVHVPVTELVIKGEVGQVVLVQAPAVDQVPELHVAERVPVYPVAHPGAHVVPLLTGRVHVPVTELGIDGAVGQLVLVQLPVVDQVPAVHVAESVPVYPVVQAGAHVAPLLTGRVHVPVTELAIEGAVAQLVLVQLPVVDQVPAVHVAESVPVNPLAHAGAHVVPLLTGRLHVPVMELAITGAVVQEALQEPVVVQTALLHVAERVPVYPLAHAGAHVVPLLTGRVHVPVMELAIEGAVVHLVLVQLPVVDQVPAAHVAESVPVYPLAHAGAQVVPLLTGRAQVPVTELAIEGAVEQLVLVQLPVVDQVPVVHVAERVPVYPVVQAGAQVVPLLTGRVHVPVAELAIEGAVEQLVLVQLPVVDQVPVVHVAERVPVNPVLHVGVQVVPEEAPATQFPAPAFVIEGSPEHVTPPVGVIHGVH
jgi:hypothetical protein